MSGSSGNKVFTLSRDHKPSDEDEKFRILEAGGKIYQSQINGQNQQSGPFRV
jgi:serine/threonine protein phosphatase PrpC